MGFKKIDLTEVESAVKNLLVALGEDVNREGLKDTPKRVAKYWAELLEGEDYTDQQVTELLQEDFNALIPKKIQKDKIEWLTREFLIALGDDPDREGLKKTPNRVARMCEEIFEGMTLTNKEIADKFNTCFEDVETGDLVVEANIPIHSFCEHHLMLMYDMSVAIGYIPNGRVIGLSKLARIADMVGKRLQLQERIGSDIADILEMILGTQDIIVVIQGKHGCMTARGIKSREAITRTATLRGKFNEDSDLRSEFYSLIR